MYTLSRFFQILFAVCVLGLLFRKRRKTKFPLPPGPPRLPIFGNAFDIPLFDMTKTYLGWTKKFGSDIIYLEALGKKTIILNSYDVASELLDKRGHIYSSRPHSTFLGELMDLGWVFAIMPYGEEWNRRRRTFVQHFSVSNPKTYQLKWTQAIHMRLLPQLLRSPQQFMEHVRHVTTGELISLAYGISVEPENDPLVNLAERAMAASAVAGIPGKFLVDIFPLLKYLPEWIPGASFQRIAREWKELWREFADRPFQMAEESILGGRAGHSFVSSSLDIMSENQDIEKQKTIVKETAITFLGAGADTTGATIVIFILAMTLNPDVQAKAQVEIDRVLENRRLPDVSDHNSLPYVAAIMREVLRWQPSSPQAVAHLNTEDDSFLGYHIPRNSIVIPNIWAMSRDESRYPEPEKFKPERFLTADGEFNPDVNDPCEFVFGFGRRRCAGIHIAMSTVWLTIASILATFQIDKCKDEFGNIIEPIVDFKSANIVALPSPFRCSIRPRSSESEKLIFAAAEHVF